MTYPGSSVLQAHRWGDTPLLKFNKVPTGRKTALPFNVKKKTAAYECSWINFLSTSLDSTWIRCGLILFRWQAIITMRPNLQLPLQTTRHTLRNCANAWFHMPLRDLQRPAPIDEVLVLFTRLTASLTNCETQFIPILRRPDQSTFRETHVSNSQISHYPHSCP